MLIAVVESKCLFYVPIPLYQIIIDQFNMWHSGVFNHGCEAVIATYGSHGLWGCWIPEGPVLWVSQEMPPFT